MNNKKNYLKNTIANMLEATADVVEIRLSRGLGIRYQPADMGRDTHNVMALYRTVDTVPSAKEVAIVENYIKQILSSRDEVSKVVALGIVTEVGKIGGLPCVFIRWLAGVYEIVEPAAARFEKKLAAIMNNYHDDPDGALEKMSNLYNDLGFNFPHTNAALLAVTVNQLILNNDHCSKDAKRKSDEFFSGA